MAKNEIIGRGGGARTMSQEETIAYWNEFRERLDRNKLPRAKSSGYSPPIKSGSTSLTLCVRFAQKLKALGSRECTNRRREETKPETEEILPTSSPPLPNKKSHDLRGG